MLIETIAKDVIVETAALYEDVEAGLALNVGDIIEIEGKVGRVEEMKLRTTRAVTIDNKVLIITNHLYLTNSLYN